MRKKALSLLLALMALGSCFAFAGSAEEAADGESGKILVAYFSATGHTEPIAETIAEALGADLYEIVPAEEYTEEDLNYNDSTTRATVEQRTADCRPELAESELDLSEYDTVLIGHPIWWGQVPKLIYTFVETYDLAGKTVTTFCTSASSGLGTSAENLQKAASGDAVWLESRRFPIGAEEEEILAWLDEIGLTGEGQ